MCSLDFQVIILQAFRKALLFGIQMRGIHRMCSIDFQHLVLQIFRKALLPGRSGFTRFWDVQDLSPDFQVIILRIFRNLVLTPSQRRMMGTATV